MPLTLGDYIHKVESLIHDSTNSAWSRKEVVRRINDARKDVSLDMQCVRNVITHVDLMPGGEMYSYDGAVVGARITDPGEGYHPEHHYAVHFTPPAPGGVHAEGYAEVWGRNLDIEGHLPREDEWPDDRMGGIRNIRMTQWGKWYTQIPEVRIAPPHHRHGRRAKAEAIVLFDVINVLSISVLWGSLRYSLKYKGFSVFQAWMRQLQAQGFRSRPIMMTIHQGDQLVYIDTVPDQHYRSDWDVVRLAHPLVGVTHVDRDIPDPFAQAVEYKAAAYLLMKHQHFDQSEYYEKKYDARVPRIIAGAGGVRIPNPYNRSFFSKMRRA